MGAVSENVREGDGHRGERNGVRPGRPDSRSGLRGGVVAMFEILVFAFSLYLVGLGVFLTWLNLGWVAFDAEGESGLWLHLRNWPSYADAVSPTLLGGLLLLWLAALRKHRRAAPVGTAVGN